ncbi:MAG: exopolysaccharide biosynthesis polyprenyl glycosylphosphotransferase [Hyphomonadaceae bacterium]|nr:exopolysaccharide biosynthesis polyprenyl glycosylphosphotransferase [Hyphomonadaceae bacterium]
MSQPALQLVGADLDQEAPPPAPDTPELMRQAKALADLAGQFGLFGLLLDANDERLWTVPADEPYRIEAGPDADPANDTRAAFAFPNIGERGLHIDPNAPARLLQIVDWCAVVVTAQLAALWGTGAGLDELSIGVALGFVLTASALKVGLWLTESYRISLARIKAERSIGGLALGVVLALVASAVLAPDARAAAALCAVVPVAAIVLAGIHAAFAVWIRAAHRKGAFSETIVLVGATEAAARMARRAARSGEARVLAIVDDRLSRSPYRIGDTPVGGNIDALLAWDALPNVDRIVITVTQKAEARVKHIIERLRLAPNRVDLLLDYETLNVRGARVDSLTGHAVACVSGRPRNHRRALVKRAQDVILSVGILAVFALPMLAIAAAIKLDSKGPALYRQRRHGFNNRVITVLKFRTMRHEPDAPMAQVVANDPRITRLGAWLRRTSLDELPQLFNVLRGEMSLVGPRPHAIGMKADERDLHDIVAEYAHRHRVKPGITGWAQINGSRGPVETPAAVRRRLKLDLEYVSRASLWLDLQILARSAPIMLGDDKAVR